MSVLKKLSQMFSRSSARKNPTEESVEEVSEPSDSSSSFAGGPPVQRRVIQAPVVAEEAKTTGESDPILIKAVLSQDKGQCKFMVNRPLMDGHSWLFSNFEEAAGSVLAEAVFSVDTMETLLIHDSTAVVTKAGPKGESDWEALAREVGAAMRTAITAGEGLIAPEILEKIPSEDVVRNQIQKVIDTEVNPGVASHGGRITLTQVAGNSITIEMGGGCQGCSAADMTLKQGIHNSFRKAVPYVGAIYDATDHTAGSNPFYR